MRIDPALQPTGRVRGHDARAHRHPRHRRGHDGGPDLRHRRERARWCAAPTASSRSTSRRRDGSSTIPRRSGTRPSPRSRRSCPNVPPRARPSPRSASRTSARRRSSGTARAVRRSTGRSSGRTAAPPRPATRSATPATSRSCAERTGLVLDPYFSATKLAWLLTDGGVSAGADLAFGTVDSWLLWKLTGGAVHATEPSNAARTLLYDIRANVLVRRAVRPLRRPSGVPARGAAHRGPLRRDRPTPRVRPDRPGVGHGG